MLTGIRKSGAATRYLPTVPRGLPGGVLQRSRCPRRGLFRLSPAGPEQRRFQVFVCAHALGDDANVEMLSASSLIRSRGRSTKRSTPAKRQAQRGGRVLGVDFRLDLEILRMLLTPAQ